MCTDFPRSTPRDARKYLADSPLIDCRDRKIRDLAKEITADKEGAWQKVEAIHNWVKDNIKHTNDKFKGTDKALSDKRGHIEDLTGLFIALCRAEKIPARTVWVPDYCYAEFYLEDADGNGHWFPCELKEKTVFGTVSNDHIILQKGDNIKVPEKRQAVPARAGICRGEGDGTTAGNVCAASRPMKRLAVILWLAAGLLPARGFSPIDDGAPAAIRLTNPRTQRWQFGVVVRARGETTGIVATLPIPMPWPEQDVKVMAEDVTPQVRSRAVPCARRRREANGRQYSAAVGR